LPERKVGWSAIDTTMGRSRAAGKT